MGDQLIASVVTVATAIVGLAIIAVLVSNRASTAQVIQAGASGFAQDLAAATNPFSGSSSFGGIGNTSFTGGGVGFQGL